MVQWLAGKLMLVGWLLRFISQRKFVFLNSFRAFHCSNNLSCCAVCLFSNSVMLWLSTVRVSVTVLWLPSFLARSLFVGASLSLTS
jgi:arginine exporter protein ArgO